MKHGARAGTRPSVRPAFVADVSLASICVFGLTVALALAAELVAATPRAAAASEPDRQPSPAPVDGTLVPELPEFPAAWQGPELPLELRMAAPFGPEDKGGSYIDMGVAGDAYPGTGKSSSTRRGTGPGTGEVAGAGELTSREQALLALSRAAVEASRAAGTLGVAATHGDPRLQRSPLAIDPNVSPSEAILQKIAERVTARATARVPGTGDPSDHAAGATTSRNSASANSGAVRLTPPEIAKRAAAGNAPGLVVLPAPAPRAQEAPGTPPNVGASATAPGAAGRVAAANSSAVDAKKED